MTNHASILRFGLFIPLLLSPNLGCSAGGGLSRTGAAGTIPDTGGAQLGTGSLGGFDYSGNGNQLPNADEQAAVQAVGDELKPLAPQAATAYPQEIVVGFQKLYQQQAKGMDTYALRISLAGQIVAACARDIERFVPRPGEPLMGGWGGACTSGSGDPVLASVWGKYPATSGGIPGGDPTLFIAALDTAGNPAAGTIKVSAEGTGDALVAAEGGTWRGILTDQPQAGTGVFTPLSGGGSCKQVSAVLVSSRNPIPVKYQEAMKRLGQCYRQAITLVSPILSSYVYELTPTSAQTVIRTLQLQ